MAFTNEEACIVLGMLARGDDNQDICAWFGVNPARIVEVSKGKYSSATAAPANELPPKGAVGPKGRRLFDKVNSAIIRLEANGSRREITRFLRDAIEDFSRDEP